MSRANKTRPKRLTPDSKDSFFRLSSVLRPELCKLNNYESGFKGLPTNSLRSLISHTRKLLFGKVLRNQPRRSGMANVPLNGSK